MIFVLLPKTQHREGGHHVETWRHARYKGAVAVFVESLHNLFEFAIYFRKIFFALRDELMIFSGVYLINATVVARSICLISLGFKGC